MLIIKDSVDLKELEKFGFSLNKNGLYYEKDFLAECFEEEENHQVLIYINKRNIVLDIMNNDYTYHSWDDELGRIEDTLYDLIQAGLVEKVEEER
jgi:hypothetical protein